MADRWIITNYPFKEHHSLKDARKEHARLSEAVPGKVFTIRRMKTTLHASKSRKIIADLEARLSKLAALQPDS